MSILEAKNISKSFGGLKAISALSFSIGKNEVIGIIGPNGAGKSTLFNMITGIYPPDSGEISFLGVDIHRLRTHKIVKLGIGRTFQNTRVIKSMTVLDNIIIGFHCRTHAGLYEAIFRNRKSIQEMNNMIDKALDILKFLQLEKKAWDLAANLSHGEQRRMEIARALATEPRLILLDEPVAGMVVEEVQAFMQTIESIRRKEITIILIEHNMSAVMGISNRVIVLNFGRKIAEGIPDDIKENPAVIEAYLGVTKNSVTKRA
jgi:branched-chain amino acid transport system ATP-binding protein